MTDAVERLALRADGWTSHEYKRQETIRKLTVELIAEMEQLNRSYARVAELKATLKEMES